MTVFVKKDIPACYSELIWASVRAGQPHCEKAAQRCVQITLIHPLMTHFSHEIHCSFTWIYKTLSDGCKEQLCSRASTLRNNEDLYCVSSLFSNLPVLHVHHLHLYSCLAGGLHACVFLLSSAICHAACAAHMYGFVLLPICLLLSLAANRTCQNTVVYYGSSAPFL